MLRENSTSNRIGGTATVVAPDIGYNLRQTYFIVGQNGRATLDITDDALLQQPCMLDAVVPAPAPSTNPATAS